MIRHVVNKPLDETDESESKTESEYTRSVIAQEHKQLALWMIIYVLFKVHLMNPSIEVMATATKR